MSYLIGSVNSVSQIIAGSNVTIEPTSGYGNVTINGSAGGGGASTGVLSLAYTTGINGSGSNGNITLSNTGVRSIIAGSGIGVNFSTGIVTISNTASSSALTLNGGSNITITNTSTINVSANPVFSNSMGFTGPTGNNVFCNAVYPFGTADYYPYIFSGSGTNVNNTIGGKQFWATNNPGSSSCNVIKYSYTGINAQQGATGTTIPFVSYNDTTGLFALSNVTSIQGIQLVNNVIAGSNIVLTSGSNGNVTVNAVDAGVATLSLASGGGLYNIGTATNPILGATVVDVLSGPGISIGSSSGNKTVSNTGVISLIEGSNISITSTTGAYTINSSSSGGGSLNSIFTPVINGAWTAVDGDVELLDRNLSFSVISNLATAETIVVHFSCGPILGQSTAGPTNASYFSIKALVSSSTLGTPVATPAYGQYVVDYGATMGGDFTVVLSKSRGNFYADSSLMMLYKMDLPSAPFSSAIVPNIAVPNIYVNMYAM
jgi:hypothetical protein